VSVTGILTPEVRFPKLDPLHRIPMPTIEHKSPRILLIRLSAIGDVVHALHALAALRAARPAAFIGFLVEDRAASLVEGHPDLDRVHVFPRKSWRQGLVRQAAGVAREANGFVADLRGTRYDVAVDFQANLKGGVLSRLSGAPRRIGLARGFGREGNHRFQTEKVRLPIGPILHRVDRALRLLEPLGVTGPAGTPRVGVPEEDRAEMDAFLRAAGLDEAPFAVLHPGTSAFGEYKRWPPERYGEFARRLSADHDLASIVTWGPGEEDLADEAVATSDRAAIRGPRTRSLSALAHLTGKAALVVAADTGALHLAAMLGTPTIGLFGPKDPRIYGPRGPRATVVCKDVDCSPCGSRTCSSGGECMNGISVEDVLAAVPDVCVGPRAES